MQRSSRGGLAALALSSSLPLLGPLQAEALPNGAKIERGNGTVSGDANRMTVRTNGRTVISWQTFNIEAGKLVDFQNDKAVLNYVRLGGAPVRSTALYAPPIRSFFSTIRASQSGDRP